ncbi:MAG: 2-hydroxyacid dehydrogenase [Candidatus Rifleibacteriota bacterium]
MKIVVSRPLPGKALDKLVQQGYEVKIMPSDRTAEEFYAEAVGTDAIVTMLSDKINRELLDKFGQNLKVIANYAVGYNNIDVAECTRKGIFVANTPDVLTDATADTAMLLILMCMRRAPESMQLLSNGKFEGWRPDLLLGLDLKNKNLGILGMGRIGQAVAKRAEAFGMKILYHTRSGVKQHLPYPAVSFATLIAESDVLSLHCPLTDATRYLIGEKELKRMKNTAVLINTARGPVIDEVALAGALKNGNLFYAGCDVFENEPEVNSELLKCKNSVLLPHIGSGTIETRNKMAEMTAESVSQCLNGEKPALAVNSLE